jgi:hypothetical protein
MKSFNLNIAGYNIGFESTDDGPDLIPSDRFLRNISGKSQGDLLIKVHSGNISLPEGSEKVFDAPYVEEINNVRIKKSDDFWSVFKNQNDLFIRTSFPLSSDGRTGLLRFSLNTKEWDLWIDGSGKATDPVEYPLDGLILYYLTVIHGDIMIHASGVNNAGHGYIFSGVSGKGKTTMARLWDRAGATIIHDDRLILRDNGNGYMMYNTPVYQNDKPSESQLTRIFIIEHGEKNELIPVSGASAVSLVIANCIQHNWDPEIITGLLGSVSAMCAEIPVARLRFIPDVSVIEHILENEARSE